MVAAIRQLIAFGIHAHFVSAAIEEAERVGLVDCRRSVGRAPNTYGLTWLPRGDDPPTHRWRQHDTTAAEVIAERRAAKTRKKPVLRVVK